MSRNSNNSQSSDKNVNDQFLKRIDDNRKGTGDLLGEIIGRKIDINEAQLTSSQARNELSINSNSRSLRISVAKEINESIKSFYTQNTNKEDKKNNKNTPRSVKALDRRLENVLKQTTTDYSGDEQLNLFQAENEQFKIQKYEDKNNIWNQGVLELAEEDQSIEMRSCKDKNDDDYTSNEMLNSGNNRDRVLLQGVNNNKRGQNINNKNMSKDHSDSPDNPNFEVHTKNSETTITMSYIKATTKDPGIGNSYMKKNDITGGFMNDGNPGEKYTKLKKSETDEERNHLNASKKDKNRNNIDNSSSDIKYNTKENRKNNMEDIDYEDYELLEQMENNHKSYSEENKDYVYKGDIKSGRNEITPLKKPDNSVASTISGHRKIDLQSKNTKNYKKSKVIDETLLLKENKNYINGNNDNQNNLNLNSNKIERTPQNSNQKDKYDKSNSTELMPNVKYNPNKNDKNADNNQNNHSVHSNNKVSDCYSGNLTKGIQKRHNNIEGIQKTANFKDSISSKYSNKLSQKYSNRNKNQGDGQNYFINSKFSDKSEYGNFNKKGIPYETQNNQKKTVKFVEVPIIREVENYKKLNKEEFSEKEATSCMCVIL